MEQRKLHEDKKSERMSLVSKALSSIYTGVFCIDLIEDRYDIIRSPQTIYSMLDGIESAQQAINCAIQNTVSKDEVLDVLTFVNMRTLPERMESEKCLNIDYKGMISGWVRGSFIEVERDQAGKVTQVLYAYQVIDEKKRKELEHLQQLKEGYAKTKQTLEKDKKLLADELKYQNSLSNVVMEQLDCGILVYTIPGRNLLQINPEALRIMGWKNRKEASEQLGKNSKNIKLIGGVNERQLLNLRKEMGAVKYQFLIDVGEETEKHILAESKSFSGRYNGTVVISTLMDITHVTALEKEKTILKD